MRKVLITGGCGFVGAAIIGELRHQNNIEIFALDLPTLEKRFAFHGQARFIGADITDRGALQKAVPEGIDVVFHTAALFKYGAPKELLDKINVQGTRCLAEVMLEKKIPRLINWGSSTVYHFWDDSKLVKDEACPIDEEELTENYAYSKRQQEKMGESFISRGLAVTTVRPGDIYGPGTPNGLALAMYFFKIGLMRSVPGLQKAYISHVHVDDVASAVIHLAQLPQAANQIYNLADSYPLSTYETLDAMAKIFNTWKLPTREKTWGLPIFHTPLPILKISGIVEEWRAKLKNTYPRFDRQSAVYATKNHIISNNKLLSAGYKLKWPDARQALPQVARWYEDNDWKVIKG